MSFPPFRRLGIVKSTAVAQVHLGDNINSQIVQNHKEKRLD